MIYESGTTPHSVRAEKMPIATLTHPASAAVEAIVLVAHAVGTSVETFLHALRAKRQERVTMNQLMALDTKTLRDIGIERGSIPEVARMLVEAPGRDPRDLGR